MAVENRDHYMQCLSFRVALRQSTSMEAIFIVAEMYSNLYFAYIV